MNADGPFALATRIVTLAAGRRPLIALDHDGTLSPIAAHPDDAVLAAGAREALERLSIRADVTVISGRGLDDLITRFAGLDVALISEHGLRHRRRDGFIEQLTGGLADDTLDVLRPQLAGLLAHRTGWYVEDKGVSIAVHHRLVPDEDVEPTLRAVRDLLGTAAARPGPNGPAGQGDPAGPGGHVQAGRSVLELRPVGADKGAALEHLIDANVTPPRTVVMVGDDATDEPALASAERLGGVGVLVATRPRTTAASARLDDPDAVVVLLTALAELLDDPPVGRHAG